MTDDGERRAKAQRFQRNLETMRRARENMQRVQEEFEAQRIEKILRAV